MSARARPTIRSRRLGSALRRYREAAKLDQMQAAEHIAASKAKISRVEAGQVAARPGDVRLLLELYGVDDPEVTSALEQLSRDANKRGWWLNFAMPDGTGDYFTLEADASHIRTWQPLFVPGLLQTPAYTGMLAKNHPIPMNGASFDEVLAVRKRRRTAFLNSGARLAAVVGEAALTSPMPDVGTQYGQLQSLLEDSREEMITLQILPSSEWLATRCAPAFIMVSFDGDWSPTAIGQDTAITMAAAEDTEHVTANAHAFEHLSATALSPAETRAFLESALADLP